MDSWFQLFVRGINPEADSPQAMKRVDDTLTGRIPAAFVAPDGLPIRTRAGLFEVRVFQRDALSFARTILTQHHDLEIVEEIKND